MCSVTFGSHLQDGPVRVCDWKLFFFLNPARRITTQLGLTSNIKGCVVSRCRNVAVAPHVRKISHMSQNEWAKSALQEGDNLGKLAFPGADFEPEVHLHPAGDE